MEGRPVSVLVIDSDQASRNFLMAQLGKNGHMVFSAANGKEGLISAWRDLPDCIILDPELPDLAGLELVTRLRQDRRTLNVRIFVLSSRENPQEMSNLLNAGCSEYLVKSSPALQKLLELLRSLETEEAVVPKQQGRLFVFLSAKGGTGTSSLCANLAMCVGMNDVERKVAVVDLVLPIGSIAHIVGYDDSLNLVTAAMLGTDQPLPQYFDDNLPHIPAWHFHLLAGAPDPESANHLSGDQIEKILTAILESYDDVFVDLGRSLSRISIPIIQKADVIALVLSTDLATADLSLTVWEYLKSLGVDSKRLFPIQNRAVGLEGMTKSELEKLLDISIGLNMPYMGDNFTVANNRHEPVTSRFPNDAATFLLKQAAVQMVAMYKERNP
jgi:pilus assembly protein CpaE